MIKCLGEIEIEVKDEETNVLRNPFRMENESKWFLYEKDLKDDLNNNFYGISPSESRIDSYWTSILPKGITADFVLSYFLTFYNKDEDDCKLRIRGEKKWCNTIKFSELVNHDRREVIDTREVYKNYKTK